LVIAAKYLFLRKIAGAILTRGRGSVMVKQPKTEAQLSEVIMNEVRKHSECANIERVAIF
jgi:hypothetical protein